MAGWDLDEPIDPRSVRRRNRPAVRSKHWPSGQIRSCIGRISGEINEWVPRDTLKLFTDGKPPQPEFMPDASGGSDVGILDVHPRRTRCAGHVVSHQERTAMPWFEPSSIHALVGDSTQGEHTLDLRGVCVTHARSAISKMLERSRSGDATSVVIRIDPATATSGETLFLPIGRQLLDARKRGLVTRFHPLPEADGGGFYVELPGRPENGEAQQ